MHELLLSAHIGLVLILVAIATEAIIEIVKESDLSLAIIHSRIVPRYEQNPTWYNWTLYKWITCGQCMSVVYSIPGAIFMSTFVSLYYLPFSFIAFLFAIQRITNWLNSSYKVLYRGRVTAIELVSPLIDFGQDSMVYDPAALLSEAKAREFRKGTEDRVIIRTLEDIKRIIKLLGEKKPDGGRTVNMSIGGSQYNVDTSTNHPPYMDIIRDAFQGVAPEDSPPPTIEINAGETLVPLDIGSNHAIDRFIEKCTGGTREGDRIKWSLPEGNYFYDPVHSKLTFSEPDDG